MQQVVVYGPHDVRIVEAPDPTPGPEDVLVKVAACGICGSDAHYIAMGGLPIPGGGPMPLGHEISGVVAAVGAAVRSATVGQRVAVRAPAGPQNRIGGGGPGGLAQYLLVRGVTRPAIDLDGGRLDTYLYPLPDALSLPEGALVEPLGVGMHAVGKAEARPGEKAVVFGAGPIGLAAVVSLRHRGVEDIVAVDLSDARLALAERLGARTVVNAAASPWERIAAAQGRESVHGLPAVGADLYIETTGAASVMREIFDHARFGARVVVVAIYEREISLPFLQIMAKELVVRGSMAVGHEFASVIEMLASGRVDVSPMIAHRFEFARVLDAFATARTPEAAGKVMVTFDA